MHQPVLLKEVVEELNLSSGKFIIDGTVDGGGHSGEIVQHLKPGGTLLGVDWDKEMVESLQSKLKTTGVKTKFIHGNYRDLPQILKEEKLGLADGLLLDLGFSSEQLEDSGRGFSFLRDEPLLMTYDDNQSPAWEVIHRMSESKLADIIYQFGGERFSRKIALAIKLAGKKSPIKTSLRLAEIVRDAVPKNYEKGRINPATRTFQALRIYLNKELDNLSSILEKLPEIIAPLGRISIISFHSLEDDLVKKTFERLVKEKKAKLVNKKPTIATAKEIAKNPRSRSAKLRTIEIL